MSRCELGVADLSRSMRKESQIPSRGDFGIEVLDRPGARVARVHKRIITRFFTLGVDADELLERDVDLTTHLEHIRDVIALQIERDGSDGADRVGDIIALGAVSSGERSDERSIFIADGECDAIDFGFAGEGGAWGCVEEIIRGGIARPQPLVHPLDPLTDLLLVVGVVDRQHRDRVGEGRESRDRVPPDASGGGVGVMELWVIRFEGFKLLEQQVKLRVGHDLRFPHVVRGVCAAQQGSEFIDSVFGITHADMIRGFVVVGAIIVHGRTVD